jgi:hypothetical protein
MSARLEPDQAKITHNLSRISSDRRLRAACRLERPEVTANPIASRAAAAPAGPSRAAPHYVTPANSRTVMQEVDDKFVVAAGCSSVIQCPQSGMITTSTLSATHRITAAIIRPNVASPPKAKTGI